jgi:tetratricopeptide (TPR) repeat protein
MIKCGRREEMIKKCREAIENGDLIRAVELGKQAIEMDPNSFDAYFCLGVAYYGMGDIEKALENFKKAKELAISKEELATVYQHTGEALIDIDRLDDALIYFNRSFNFFFYNL